VAEQLDQFHKAVNEQIEKGTEKRLAIVNVLRQYIKESKDIRFEGDGYSAEWVKEAERRGLGNLKAMPYALDAYVKESSLKLFEKHEVMSQKETEARTEIRWEAYIKRVQIEARVMGDLAMNHIVPTAISYQTKLIENANGLAGLGIDNTAVVQTIKQIAGHIDTIKNNVRAMNEERKRVNKIASSHERAIAYCDDIKEKYFDKIRDAVDRLELLVDNGDWPLVKYRELLFLR